MSSQLQFSETTQLSDFTIHRSLGSGQFDHSPGFPGFLSDIEEVQLVFARGSLCKKKLKLKTELPDRYY